MRSKSAITKLKAILIIDVIIIALASGSYFYLQNQGLIGVATKPAQFTVSNLTINPSESYIGQPVTISFNATNIGKEEGNYSASLIINDLVKETKIIPLLGGESKIVEFTDSEDNEGNYSVKIGNLNGTFTIIAFPSTTTFQVSSLFIDPIEAWVGETINISVKARNIGDQANVFRIAFKVNNAIRTNVLVELAAGETKTVIGTINETKEGTYAANVEGLIGHFDVVPTGKHTLQVLLSGSSYAMSFTLDGASQTCAYSGLLDVGTHTVTVTDLVSTGEAVYQFSRWEDGSKNLARTVNLQSRTAVVVSYNLISGHASCPSLFIWNGTNYVYRTEVSSGTGYLGILDYFQNYTPVFAYSYPWDYLKLDKNQLQPKNGYYDMTMTQLWDELFYIDAVHLVAVDHAPNVDVFSTKSTYLYKLDDQGKIYTISKNPSLPISAINGEGENVLPQISKLDGVNTPSHGDFHWETLELNLGNLSARRR